MIERLEALPEVLGKVEGLIADTGYFSAHNVACCEAAKITPYIAVGKEQHHAPLMLRGLEKVTGEWVLVCLAYNVKRLRVLAG